MLANVKINQFILVGSIDPKIIKIQNKLHQEYTF